MKIINSLLVIIFFLPNNIYSQSKLTSEILVEYDMILDLNNLTHYNAYLYFNSSNAYFEYKPVESYNSLEEVQDNDNEASLNLIDSTTVQLTIDKINNKVLEKRKPVFSKKMYVVEEDIPKIQWTLAEETKKINEFSCKKALTTFRGRKYEVWYCPELPFNYGPWKLSGLPGLILEANDDKNQVVFNVKKIVTPYHIEMPNILKENTKTITIAEYSKIQKKEIENFESRFKSRSNRDMELHITYNVNDIEKE
ncbi:MAG: GLPGLI family protein [Bacteroidales bacterium]|jgi:GLPGLI family protein|nr:GLPGLI family protein [Bacteroidales bacterium]